MSTVFRFRSWDIANDCYQNSRRWATKEAIARVMGEVIGEGFEVDDQYIGGEVDAMTARNVDPRRPPRCGFGGEPI